MLLLNRIDGRKIRHEVSESIGRINEQGRFEICLSEESKEFIARLEINAADRYLEDSWYIMPGDLQRLDRAVVEIRRYCQVLDYEIEKPDGKKVDLFQMNLDRITPRADRPLANVSLMGGWLEQVAEKADHPAREGLLWDNSFFGTPAENPIATWDYSESENSPFDLHPEAIGELEKLIHLTKVRKPSGTC